MSHLKAFKQEPKALNINLLAEIILLYKEILKYIFGIKKLTKKNKENLQFILLTII